ncbi:hypothetical protein AAF712_003676 [Marasmius tenuissimus]|uniref:Uncharacterized protein n=1 Tax=Marasmius tenuissimus TaxID=585030 RepID=A0ABR3A5Z7_9AGAR|nr:hypothetical protein PM082_008591 [Marasmius tenuissimus]
MVAFAALLAAFAYLLVIPLQVVAVPPEFLLNPPGSSAMIETKNRTDIPTANIPADCQQQCPEQTLKIISNCTTQNCDCQDARNTDITTCLDCLVATTDGTKKISQSTREALEAEYVNTCAMKGVRITNAKNGNPNSASGLFASMGMGNGKAGVVGTVLVAAILSTVV